MKKFVIGLLMLFVFAVTLPLTAEAQCRRGRSYRNGNVSRNYYRTNRRYAPQRYYSTRGYSYQRPSFYRRHRNIVNLGVATGGGALLGGLIGRSGRSTAAGALIGAGAGALYTYVLRPKRRRY